MPSWLFGQLSNSDANDLLASGPGSSDGRFLVRTRGEDHVISVVYKGKGTHHLVRRNDDGFLTVNKKTYGESRTIEELIETLKQPCDGWPVLLTTHPETHPANDKGNATPAQQDEEPEWLHGAISREDAETLVKSAGLQDGQFLVRKREGQPGQYVLCVVYRGKPTHHLVAKNDDGVYEFNKRVYGAGSSELVPAIATLQQPKVAGWPVPLTTPISASVPTATPNTVPESPKTEPETTPPADVHEDNSTATDTATASEDAVKQSAEERIARAALEVASTSEDGDGVAQREEETAEETTEGDSPVTAVPEPTAAAASQETKVEDQSSPLTTPARTTRESEDEAEVEEAQEALAEVKATVAAAAAAAAVKKSIPSELEPSDKAHPATRLIPTLPQGWRMVPSRSNPGEFVYENINTLERQSWVPTQPASLSVGQLKTAVAANEMERQLAQRRLSEVRAMQQLAMTTSGALGPARADEHDPQRAMELLIQQQNYQLETEQRAHAKLLAQTAQKRKTAKKTAKSGQPSSDPSRERRQSNSKSVQKTSKPKVNQHRKNSLREAEAQLHQKELELLESLNGKSEASRSLTKKIASAKHDANVKSRATVVNNDGLYITPGGHVDRTGTFSHV